MSKLKYALFELNHNIIFTIFEQDKRFIANDEWDSRLEFKASNGWKIKSQSEPEINYNSKEVFLRGTNENKDNKICLVTVETDRRDYIEKICNEINRAIYEWAIQWENWKGEPSDIFKFRIQSV